MGAVLDLHADLSGPPLPSSADPAGAPAGAKVLRLSPASVLEALQRDARAREEGSEALLPRGRLVELCAAPSCGGSTSWAAAALREAQLEGAPVAWIQSEDGDLYPPDLERAGLDLSALIVVRVPREAKRAAGAEAAEQLLRTGAFGALVLDLTGSPPPRGQAWQGRLLSLARQHHALLLLLSPRRPEEPSLGPLISVRLVPESGRLAPGRFRLQATIAKNKSGLPLHREEGQGPLGAPFRRRGASLPPRLPSRMAESPPGLW